ncbi:hypothetical protein [Nocardia sp. XZ_19_385]|uniref:hypothetical protein n=1 Tax=Nocardia sp. XZ_19_385 TaxID=2769488 RepID=UPI00188EDE66|nr:hypothetical protein [Nocardia sp. XZ_19_385]
MNSASQSNPGAEDARQLLGNMTTLTQRGWKLAAPMWFPLLCVAVAVLASVPATLLLNARNGVGWYWLVVSPLTAVVCGWYFVRRPAQLPDVRGVAVLITGIAMVVAAEVIGWVYDGAWAMVAPWLAVGLGLAVFAVALRSAATAVVALATIGVSVAVAVIEPEHGYAWIALVVGLTAAVAAVTELMRAETGPTP